MITESAQATSSFDLNATESAFSLYSEVKTSPDRNRNAQAESARILSCTCQA
ncbi:hypothetical protein BMETH_1368_2 [methanotrophic bacterial endosymbiont of Bathymodiolus sp.]|nr:hypothetical protein BMETH_1368_2 [methanotrophic bacterial endosymbiont of Bathymodiolus sp.]